MLNQTTAQAAAARSSRIAAVDVVRGAVMVLMALDHVRDWVTSARIQPEDLSRASAALFAIVEFAIGQVFEPLLYGHSTGLSPVAVIVSVTFWTWLWGPVGLLLATPLTVCLVVLGRHVDRMEFLDVMLGDRPPLTEAESFYQRLLAHVEATGAYSSV